MSCFSSSVKPFNIMRFDAAIIIKSILGNVRHYNLNVFLGNAICLFSDVVIACECVYEMLLLVTH